MIFPRSPEMAIRSELALLVVLPDLGHHCCDRPGSGGGARRSPVERGRSSRRVPGPLRVVEARRQRFLQRPRREGARGRAADRRRRSDQGGVGPRPARQGEAQARRPAAGHRAPGASAGQGRRARSRGAGGHGAGVRVATGAGVARLRRGSELHRAQRRTKLHAPGQGQRRALAARGGAQGRRPLPRLCAEVRGQSSDRHPGEVAAQRGASGVGRLARRRARRSPSPR